MKSLGKKGILAVTLALVLIAVSSVLAAGFIFSNIVTVHVIEKPVPVTYVLTLEPAEQTIYIGESITLTATLTGDGAPIEAATIHLYMVTGAGDIEVGTGVTDASGQCSLGYGPIVTAKDYNYKAGYQTP